MSIIDLDISIQVIPPPEREILDDRLLHNETVVGATPLEEGIEQTYVSRSRAYGIICILCLVTFIASASTGLLTSSVPTITKDLSIPSSGSYLPLSVYGLTSGASLLVSGSVADAVGSRVIFLIGALLQSAFILGCGLARTSIQLVIFRALQGISVALCLPTATDILSNTMSPGRRRNVGFACTGLGQSLGYSAGLVLGGLFVDTLGWRAASGPYSQLPLETTTICKHLCYGVTVIRGSANHGTLLHSILPKSTAGKPLGVVASTIAGPDRWVHHWTIYRRFRAPPIAKVYYICVVAALVWCVANYGYGKARVAILVGVFPCATSTTGPTLILIGKQASADVLFCVGVITVSEVFPRDMQSLAGAVFNTAAQLGTSLGLAFTSLLSDSVMRAAELHGDQMPAALGKGYAAAFWLAFGWLLVALEYQWSVIVPVLALFLGSRVKPAHDSHVLTPASDGLERYDRATAAGAYDRSSVITLAPPVAPPLQIDTSRHPALPHAPRSPSSGNRTTGPRLVSLYQYLIFVGPRIDSQTLFINYVASNRFLYTVSQAYVDARLRNTRETALKCPVGVTPTVTTTHIVKLEE
ncbi:hypothetical protein NPX13_g3927 [Xylaria arbuscula]|uniref:Major facilitator superfamily (MFS) profile domain-containing protein n=1 Tax=Xylaria arbuscula TaxID=114810 RepID=A0A9W8TMQ9_9PEZI|nr:hypothetical protein NPX13_g3927 [Xylaria arbuscula]